MKIADYSGGQAGLAASGPAHANALAPLRPGRSAIGLPRGHDTSGYEVEKNISVLGWK